MNRTTRYITLLRKLLIVPTLCVYFVCGKSLVQIIVAWITKVENRKKMTKLFFQLKFLMNFWIKDSEWNGHEFHWDSKKVSNLTELWFEWVKTGKKTQEFD